MIHGCHFFYACDHVNACGVAHADWVLHQAVVSYAESVFVDAGLNDKTRGPRMMDVNQCFFAECSSLLSDGSEERSFGRISAN